MSMVQISQAQILSEWKRSLLLGVILVLVTLLLGVSPGLAKEIKCYECGDMFDIEDAAYWGKHSYCDESCRDTWYERYREVHNNCKICGTDPERPGTVQRHHGITYIVTGGPKWDGFCDDCRQEYKDGLIDKATLVEAKATGKRVMQPGWKIRGEYEKHAAEPSTKASAPSLDVAPVQKSGFKVPTWVFFLGALGTLAVFFKLR